MPGNLCYQHNSRKRRTLNSHQECRHGYQHDVSDILRLDNAVPHSNQPYKLPQQPACHQSRNKASARKTGRNGAYRETEMQQHDGKYPHYFRTAVLRLFQQELFAATRQVYLHQ